MKITPPISTLKRQNQAESPVVSLPSSEGKRRRKLNMSGARPNGIFTLNFILIFDEI